MKNGNTILKLIIFSPLYADVRQSHIYNKDSTLYFSHGSILDSVNFKLSDFIPTQNIIYNKQIKEPNSKKNNIYLVVFIVILAIALIIFLLKKYRQFIIDNFKATLKKEETNSETALEFIEFNEQEKQLIALLLKNSNVNKKTSIDEINIILGLQNRSIDTQKQQRHKLLTSINSKFSSRFKRILIQRAPLDIDKRLNEYFIQKVEMDTLKQVMKDN
jgi:cell division protein FtsL